ncbi:MAG TPA: tetratricopeptide repeat protein [Anaeromyxobacteraceae bacterium]|nr:tetratricopeptide repeat protein [Anaeromyxobacteraceae bacterium]
MWGYPTRDVARTLGLPESRVRSFARAGFARPRRGPRGELRFSFEDLVLLRAAAGLLRARVPPRRVRQALRRLRQELPEGHGLAGVSIAADGERVVVRQGGALWRPESGQTVFDFEVKDLAEKVAPLLDRPAANRALAAADWYEWGCDLEDGAPEQAKGAYRRALALDPAHPGANLNLGRLLHGAGDPGAAEVHYRRALLARPGDAVALYDLGVALEDRGRLEEALGCYRRALEIEPAMVDAHHNAARLCERMGRRAEVVRHLAALRRLGRASGPR